MSYEALLINTSDIIRRTFDKWGEEESITEIKNRPCRIMYKTERVVDEHGEEVISAATIFYGPDEEIEHKDFIRFDGREHAIIRINRPQDSVQRHHLEVKVK